MVVGPGGVGTSENSGPGCWIPSVGKTPKKKTFGNSFRNTAL